MNTASPLAAERPALQLVSRDQHAAAIQERIDAVEAFDNVTFTPTRERPSPVMLGRGVRFLPYWDINGNPIAVAVQSSGRIAHWASWLPDMNYDDFMRELWEVLNQADRIGATG